MDLYIHPLSTPSLTVEMTARAARIEFNRHVVNLPAGEHREAAYKALHPGARIPAMRDGDFTLFESGAIAKYIGRISGAGLYPDSIKDQSKVDQWVDYCAHHIRNPMNRVQFNRLIAPMIGADIDEKSLALGETFLAANLPVIDDQLGKAGHLCGSTLTIADTALIAALDPAEKLGVDLSPYKNIMAWRDRLRESDWYQSVHGHFGAEIGL